ncbi:MAG: glutathione S-transferase [Alphaproteobacteria bacterium]|jgi:glutathione S-transferase
MKLYHAAASPYARKARVTLREAGIADRVEEVSVAPWTDPDGYRDVTPLGKVPALARDDGPNLFQSVVICEYLASQNPAANLYPTDGEARWTVLRQIAAADGILDASVGERVEGMFHEGDKVSQKFLDRQEVTVEKALDLLEADTAALEGPVTAGQIAVACALAYRDFRFADKDWRSAHPNLAAWYETFSQRPSMQETQPEA